MIGVGRIDIVVKAPSAFSQHEELPTWRITLQRVYFDSHVYDELIEPGNRSFRKQLVLSIHTRRCEVYGSLATIEELSGLVANDESRYRSLVDCFWDCVRSNVLLDRALLLQDESRKSNRLGMREACFWRSFVAKIKRASHDNLGMMSVAAEVLGKKQDEAAAMNRRFEEAEFKITEAVEEERHRHGPETDTEYQQWLNCVSEAEVQDWFDTHRTGNSASCISWKRAPCTAALIGWTIARAKMNLMHGKRYERSASHDRDHFIYATQTGTLVTNDVDLARTVRFIQPPLATVQTTAQFCKSVLTVNSDV